jgi:hypothetical protein
MQRRADRAAIESEVEAPEGDSGDHRELLPAEAVLKHRSLAPRGPGSCATRSLRQPRLIDEDDDSALSRRYFFSAGHLRAFQVRIAFSLRCRACPLGRCTLQPSDRSSRHTEGSVSAGPNTRTPVVRARVLRVFRPPLCVPHFEHRMRLPTASSVADRPHRRASASGSAKGSQFFVSMAIFAAATATARTNA